MRRPSIACRRAVQSLQPPAPQHVWISDELLSSTLRQFLRNSCPHQRRHGSHVPGPLEARRRAAKRRMTVSANFYPQDSFPSSFSLGALFGFRSSPQPSWRYEPPSRQVDVDASSRTIQNGQSINCKILTDTAPNGSASISDLAPTTSLNVAHSTRRPTHNSPYSFVQNISGDDLVEVVTTNDVEATNTSRAVDFEACFEAFKLRIAAASEFSREDRKRSLVDAFQACCSDHPDAWIYNTMVIRYLADIKCDIVPLLLARDVSSFAIPPTYSAANLDLLHSLSKLLSTFPESVRHYHQLFLRLADTASSAPNSSSTLQDVILLSIVRQLWHTTPSESLVLDLPSETICRVASNVRNRSGSRALQAILTNTARVEHQISLLVVRASEDPSALLAAESVLSCIPEHSLSACIPHVTSNLVKAAAHKSRLSTATYNHRIQVWLQLLQGLDRDSTVHGSSFLSTAITTLAKQAFSRGNLASFYFEPLLRALLLAISQEGGTSLVSIQVSELVEPRSTTSDHNALTFDATLHKVMSRLHKKGLLQRAFIETTLSVLVRHATLDTTLRFLNALNSRGLTLRNAVGLEGVLAERIARISSTVSGATNSQRQRNAFALRTCQRILEVLGQMGLTLGSTMPELKTLQAQRQFQHVISHAQACNALPLVYRNIPTNLPTTQRVDLIHQLAHQYSTDTTRSHREANRAIYYLYRYLQENSLPIGPLFSKAVVRASIVRPLSENRYVSARRMIWACQLVARVEGEEVAKRIENTFWHWRGDLIKHAKSVYIGVGGERGSKAHVGTMKRLGLI